MPSLDFHLHLDFKVLADSLKYDHLFILIFRVTVPRHSLFITLAYLKDNYTVRTSKMFLIIQFYLSLNILQDPGTVVDLIHGILKSPAKLIQKLGKLCPSPVVGEIIRKDEHVIFLGAQTPETHYPGP